MLRNIEEIVAYKSKKKGESCVQLYYTALL